MKTVSIMIPVYNVEGYLENCIGSVISQTYNALEILLIDDGSTDGSGDICNEYAKRDSRIRVIHTSNMGVSNARNTALDNASGELLLFVDGDDTIESCAVAELVKTMDAANADIVIGRFKKLDENGAVMYESASCDGEVLSKQEALKRLLKYQLSPSVCNALLKREMYDGVRQPIGWVCAQDLATTYRVLAKAERVAFNGNAVYYYIHRSGSTTRKPFSKARIYDVLASEAQLEFIKSNYPELEDDAKRHVFWQSYSLLRNAEAEGFCDNDFFEKPLRNCKSLLKYHMQGERPTKQKLKTWGYIKLNKFYRAFLKLRQTK